MAGVTSILMLFSQGSVSEQQKKSIDDMVNPIEQMAILQNPRNAAESAIVVEICGGKRLIMKVPTADLKTRQEEILKVLVDKIREICGRET